MSDQWAHLPDEGEYVRVTYTSNQPDAGEQTKLGVVTSVLRVERGKFWMKPDDGPNTLEVEPTGRQRIFAMTPSKTMPIGTVESVEVVDG